jgi:hypothetical protein
MLESTIAKNIAIKLCQSVLIFNEINKLKHNFQRKTVFYLGNFLVLETLTFLLGHIANSK